MTDWLVSELWMAAELVPAIAAWRLAGLLSLSAASTVLADMLVTRPTSLPPAPLSAYPMVVPSGPPLPDAERQDF